MDSTHGRSGARMAAIACLLLLGAPARAEGTLDPSFGASGITRTAFGSGHWDAPRDLLVQPDGRILTAGKSDATDGATYVATSRHSADGVLDSTGFGVGGKVLTRFVFRDHANAIALHGDGKGQAVGAWKQGRIR